MPSASYRRSFTIVLACSIHIAAAPPLPAEPDPPLEMLEFLGDWQTRDGKNIDPFELEEHENMPPDVRQLHRSRPERSRTETPQEVQGRKASKPQDRLPEASSR